MKLISIRQTWAWHIVHGEKDVENRTWKTFYRGPILIHASKDRSPAAPPVTSDEPIRFGGVVGIARVVACVTSHDSRWFEGPFGFVLIDRRPLPFTPWPGALSLRDAPEELVERIGKHNLREYLAP